MVEIDDFIDICKRASKEILKIYNEGFTVELKDDKSPVTKADLASNEIIIDSIEKLYKYPIITEESPIGYENRKDFNKFFLIDPLDGTKDFIDRKKEFTINIALIKGNRPIFGMIYIPFSGDVYYALKNGGSFRNGKKIHNNSKRESLIGTKSNFFSNKETNDFFKRHNIVEIKEYGSAVKLCKIADGEVDVYPRFNGTSEWDTAAGDIILQEANCKMIDYATNNSMIYNKKSFTNNHFIASRKDLNLR